MAFFDRNSFILFNAQLEKERKKYLVLDGAMGTELNRRGVQTKLPLWTAESNISHPFLVEQIHKEYIQSGADIITTNTFRSTSWSYMRAGFKS